MNEAAIAILATLLGGVGVKAIERLLPSQDRRMDDATAIRKELRDENRALRLDCDKANAANDLLVRENAQLVATVQTITGQRDAALLDLANYRDRTWKAEVQLDELRRRQA